jgi:hypothetical protein
LASIVGTAVNICRGGDSDVALPSDLVVVSELPSASRPAQSASASLSAPSAPAATIDAANHLNIYRETTLGKLSPTVASALPRVYVPHITSQDVCVIGPATKKVVNRLTVGHDPQHVSKPTISARPPLPAA